MLRLIPQIILIFFFNDTATTEIYTLSLHDALPICVKDADKEAVIPVAREFVKLGFGIIATSGTAAALAKAKRSEEHTSELQSPYDLVCRLLLEKKKHNQSQILYVANTTDPTLRI